MSDELIEKIASSIEAPDILDMAGILSKRKRDREKAAVRRYTRVEQRLELARYIRSFKSGQGNNPQTKLERIAANTDGFNDVYLLRDAWPLSWRGLCNIYVTIRVNDNGIPPETSYRIELTDKGREMLAGSDSRKNPESSVADGAQVIETNSPLGS